MWPPRSCIGRLQNGPDITNCPILLETNYRVLRGPTSTYHAQLYHKCVKCLSLQADQGITHTLTNNTQVMFWHINYQRWKHTQLYNYKLIQKSLPAQPKELKVTMYDITASEADSIWSDKRLVMMVSSFHSHIAKTDRWHFQEVNCNYTLWMLLNKLITGQLFLHKETCYWWLENIFLFDITVVNRFKSETFEVPTLQK
jgi:hypothetical protein